MTEWISSRNYIKDKLNKLSPQDRLAYVDACIQCIGAIGRSNIGWLQWLSNPSMMSEFDEETLRQFFGKLKEFALAYIEFDIAATKKGFKPESRESKPYG